ncbi:MAG: energy-coupled thiamine transporter ThiT [Clostridia bacterium]|nr:energy-coupled thiamine transporter ThiT [Clostridia bacterium]
MNTQKNTKKLVVTAGLIALGTILSLLKLFEMPFGGTITVASMVPILLVGYIYGIKWGLFSSLVYSLLQLVCGIATGIVSRMFLPGDEQMVLWQAISICIFDYILAYVALGFGGIFKEKLQKPVLELVLGIIFSTFLCWLMHTISGYIFYGAWAEWFFSAEDGLSVIPAFKGFCKMVMNNFEGKSLALLYSGIYNGIYMLGETIISVAIAPIVYIRLKKQNLAD